MRVAQQSAENCKPGRTFMVQTFGQPMPRFYYEMDDGGFHTHDDEGQELADRKAARNEAMAALTEMARGLPSRGKDQNRIIARVRDEAGVLVFTATLTLDVEWNE